MSLVASRAEMAGTLLEEAPAIRLDYSFLRRVFLGIGVALLFLAPTARDPLAFAAGALVPWLMFSIINTPTMPAAICFFLLWQWLEVFTRAILTFVDGEAMGAGIYGETVARAYWYMLASLIVFAIAFRITLGNLREPGRYFRNAHRHWRPQDMFACYIGGLLAGVFYRYGSAALPSLDQPLEAVGRLKIVGLFLLFTYVLSTGRGRGYLWMAVAFELVSGFGGLFSDFKSVFMILGMAALAARIRWTGTLAVLAVALLSLGTGLALFWTAVKSDFRQFATGSDESQYVKVDLSDRYGYLGDKASSLDTIEWGLAAQALLNRVAYTDIFGSVIAVQENSGTAESYPRQWSDALNHIFKPRFLFPDKGQLSDTEVYARLALGNVSEEMRGGTSISVGYMAENFADFGFPGMLVGIFVLGVIVGGICRYFMMIQLPWYVREGVVMAFIYTCATTGAEISLPKMLGAAVMFTIIYAVLVRYFLPRIWHWLDDRAGYQEVQLS
ncbi:MAG: hypothetical protein JSR24_01085 [Proteobacteria bacterium]|nr:hypothetical protein [Pseudomonadota bacterium]